MNEPNDRERKLANDLCMELCFTPEDSDDRLVAERYLRDYREELERSFLEETLKLELHKRDIIEAELRERIGRLEKMENEYAKFLAHPGWGR